MEAAGAAQEAAKDLEMKGTVGSDCREDWADPGLPAQASEAPTRAASVASEGHKSTSRRADVSREGSAGWVLDS